MGGSALYAVLSGAFVALVLVLPAEGQPVAGAPHSSRVRIGGDFSRYEVQYGLPEDRSLDEMFEGPESWPRRQAIRTVGTVVRVLRWHPRCEDSEACKSLRHHYILSGKAHSLKPTPVPEIADAYAFHMPFSLARDAEVIGAFEGATFLVWSVLVLPEGEEDELSAPRSTLEALVTDLEGSAGSAVTVKGTFRGANLFGDLPAESRRHDGDWVLRDGPFFIWVTGARPEGNGFSLGLQRRSDCGWRLAVMGEVETHDGYVYLRASKARLLGRARDEPEAEDP